MSSATPTDLDTSADGQNPPRGSEYAQLSRLIRQACCTTAPATTAEIAATALLLAAGWACLVSDCVVDHGRGRVPGRDVRRMGFLGHDAGHKQISGSRRANCLLGVLHRNLGIGLSYVLVGGQAQPASRTPNTEGADPGHRHLRDRIQRRPGPAPRPGRVRRPDDALPGLPVSPMLLGEAIQLHAASIKAVATRASAPPGRDPAAGHPHDRLPGHRPAGAVSRSLTRALIWSFSRCRQDRDSRVQSSCLASWWRAAQPAPQRSPPAIGRCCGRRG